MNRSTGLCIVGGGLCIYLSSPFSHSYSHTPAFLLQLWHEFRIRISSFFRLQCGNLDLTMLEPGIPKTIISTLRSIKSRSRRALLFHSPAVHLLRVVFNFIICISISQQFFGGSSWEIHPLNRFPTHDIGYKWKEIWRDFRRIWHRLALEIAQNIMLSITGFYQKKVVVRIST